MASGPSASCLLAASIAALCFACTDEGVATDAGQTEDTVSDIPDDSGISIPDPVSPVFVEQEVFGDDAPAALESENRVNYCGGGTVHDADGDGDLDVIYITACVDGARACVFENLSQYGEIEVAQEAASCSQPAATGAIGLPRNSAGVSRWLAFGREFIELRTETDSQALPLPGCVVSSVLPIDTDADGTLELVVACREGVTGDLCNAASPRVGPARPILLRLGDESLSTLGTLPIAPSNVLALAATDLDGDGMTEVVFAADVRLNGGAVDFGADPGGIWRYDPLLGIAAGEMLRSASGSMAWLAAMGVAQIDVDDRRLLVMSNIGAPLVAEWNAANGGFEEVGDDPGLEALRLSEQSVSWGLLAGDWSMDGRDDLLITRGRLVEEEDAGSHLFFPQTPEGTFAEAAGNAFPEAPYGSGAERGAVAADLDHDGAGELIIFRCGEPPLILEEQAAAPRRCTLNPAPRYAVTSGHGYSMEHVVDGRLSSSGAAVQGQMQVGHPPQILATRRAGTLRFPSGAAVDYACDDNEGFVAVTEPEWLRYERNGEDLLISIDDSAFASPTTDLRLLFPSADGVLERVAARSGADWVVSDIGEVSARQFMLTRNGHRVSRRLALSGAP